MTILALAQLGQLAVSFFEIPVIIEDVEYTKTDYQDVPGEPVSRTIQAAIDPTNKEKLQFIFGGNIEDGDVGIYTKEFLYVPSQGETKQSYLLDGNIRYRIVQKADWTKQLGVYVYLGRVHVEQYFN
jgi:hypothetical protein